MSAVQDKRAIMEVQLLRGCRSFKTEEEEMGLPSEQQFKHKVIKLKNRSSKLLSNLGHQIMDSMFLVLPEEYCCAVLCKIYLFELYIMF